MEERVVVAAWGWERLYMTCLGPFPANDTTALMLQTKSSFYFEDPQYSFWFQYDVIITGYLTHRPVIDVMLWKNVSLDTQCRGKCVWQHPAWEGKLDVGPPANRSGPNSTGGGRDNGLGRARRGVQILIDRSSALRRDGERLKRGQVWKGEGGRGQFFVLEGLKSQEALTLIVCRLL